MYTKNELSRIKGTGYRLSLAYSRYIRVVPNIIVIQVYQLYLVKSKLLWVTTLLINNLDKNGRQLYQTESKYPLLGGTVN